MLTRQLMQTAESANRHIGAGNHGRAVTSHRFVVGLAFESTVARGREKPSSASFWIDRATLRHTISVIAMGTGSQKAQHPVRADDPALSLQEVSGWSDDCLKYGSRQARTTGNLLASPLVVATDS